MLLVLREPGRDPSQYLLLDTGGVACDSAV